MEEKYDAIVLGTGLKECILSGLLSVNGYKVLHMDKNDYYGGETASLNLEQLYERFKAGAKVPEEYGRARDWYIDLVPKFILGEGLMIDTLRHTEVTKYMDFKVVNGSFVLRTKDRSINKIPTTTKEVLDSKLCGLAEKNHMRKILNYIADCEEKPEPYNLKEMPMRDLFKAFKIGDDVATFMGHAMALWLDDSYLDRPAIETCRRIHNYVYSVATFDASPYVYPLYGLGELPQAFARLSAIWGGTYMLRTPIDEILYNEDGTVKGIRSGKENAYCKWLIMDPTYFPDLSKSVGRVSRGIFILDGPIEECIKQLKSKGDKIPTSAQIIIDYHQAGRKSDVYVTTQGSGHKVVPANLKKPFMLGFVSANAEAETPAEDLKSGIDILSRAGIREQFLFTTEVTCPKDGLTAKNIFISKGYDATSHFETTVQDVLEMYTKITGKVIDLKAPPRKPEAPVPEKK